MRKFLLSLVSLLCICYISDAQEVTNRIFAERDSSLSMDIYYPEVVADKNPTVIFIFGGGFVSGSKSNTKNVDFCTKMAQEGFIVAAIDYRLGMKGEKNVGVFNVKPLRNAINMAVEDLYSATSFLLDNAPELKIDTESIILCGSSAGAITALQADYELANRREVASVLPADFKYAGVISFAGAILSFNGKPKYSSHPPAPTMMFHGMDDKLVFYNKLQVFNLGMFGSNALTKRFEKLNYPYWTIRYRDMGHEIAEIPMDIHIPEVIAFIREFIFNKRHLKIDATIKDSELKPTFGKMTPKTMYN